MIFGVSCKEIKAAATVADPTIGKLDAAIREPGGVGGFDAVDDFSQQTAIAGKDRHADDLIFLHRAICNESIQGLVEDGADY